MSKVCQITGKKAITGNNVSHSKRRTKRKFNVNVFNRKFYWPEQDQWVRLTVSAAGLRNINKMGLDAALKRVHRAEGYWRSRHQPLHHDQEPQEHHRAFGAQEVQSLSETHDRSQGDQVIVVKPFNDDRILWQRK